jgi:hypothetical protein
MELGVPFLFRMTEFDKVSNCVTSIVTPPILGVEGVYASNVSSSNKVQEVSIEKFSNTGIF